MADVTIEDKVIEVSKRAAEDLQPLLDELAALRAQKAEMEAQAARQALTQEAKRAPQAKSLRIHAGVKALERYNVDAGDLMEIAARMEELSAFMDSRHVRVRMRMGEAWIEHDQLPGGRRENALATFYPPRIFAEG